MIVFLDLETTGLDPANGLILEVAAAAVDGQLARLDTFHRVVRPTTPPPEMAPAVVEMHTRNGLFAALPHGQIQAEVERELYAWLAAKCAREELPTLAGNSVHFDLAWLRHWWPDVASLFSHRLLDVTALKLARDVAGLPECPIHAGDAHRACGDVEASIAQAQWLISRVTA